MKMMKIWQKKMSTKVLCEQKIKKIWNMCTTTSPKKWKKKEDDFMDSLIQEYFKKKRVKPKTPDRWNLII